jgi:hypothetical protein
LTDLLPGRIFAGEAALKPCAPVPPVPQGFRVPGLEVWYEREPDGELFAHLRITDGSIFGKARVLRERIRPGSWVSLGPEHQPGGTWWLCRHAGFVFVTRRVVDGEHCDLVWKPTIWGRGLLWRHGA